jgi:alpha-beta hydrolase superfamily lysophospholipase
MARGVARIVLIGAGLLVLVMTVAMIWLKAHEDDIVFAAARSRQNILTVLPADAQRVTLPTPNGAGLASLVYRADGAADNGFWVLLLHGNADSTFSRWQVRHCEALREAGFNLLEIDYRGFGLTPGEPSETAMYEDAEAAYQALLQRGVPANRVILLGHSLGSGPAVLLATRHEAAALVLFGAFTSLPDAAAYRYPYLPVRMAIKVQFNSLARIGAVHMPIVIAHSRGDKVIPYSEGVELFAAAHEPKRFIALEPTDDGLGGHVDALYEHVDKLRSALSALMPATAVSGAPN